MLIKVGESTFSVEFTVIETKTIMSPRNKMSRILGRSFLGTLNALSNCKSGKMMLTFRNMAMEFNVFILQKQAMVFDDVYHSTINWVRDFSLENVEAILKKN